jgi:hypothetical protein
MPTENPTFSPACTMPISSFVNAESRIQELREMLLDKSLEHQKENISLAIHLYETGQLPKGSGVTTLFLNGKVYEELPAEIPEGSVIWAEVCLTSILCYGFTYSTLRVSIRSLCRPLRHHRYCLMIAIAVRSTCSLTVIIRYIHSNGTISVLWEIRWKLYARGTALNPF